MTLYDYLEINREDIDTCDTEYEAIITVCYIDEEDDEYDKFCNNITKKVEISPCSVNCIVVNWCELVKRNMEQFKEFSKKHWKEQYEEDEDEFVYQWLREFHLAIAGYTSERVYKLFNELISTLE